MIFQPAPNASVTVTGELTIRATHLELRRMTLNDLELPRDADNVTLRGIRNHGFWIEGASNITFIGGEVSCGKCPFHPFLTDGGAPDNRPPRNIVLRRRLLPRLASVPARPAHGVPADPLRGRCDDPQLGLQKLRDADGGRGATANLQISWIGRGPKTRNILIENNFFYPSGNHYAINAGDWSNLDFRYNSIAAPIIVGSGWGDGTPVEFVGNVMRLEQCQGPRTGTGTSAKYVYRNNVLDGGTCGPNDRNAPSGFVDAARNLRLKPNAAAINAGDPASFPQRDIDGERRPKGGRPDAGADERR